MKNNLSKRIFGLDIVRAMAISLVVISHISFLVYPNSLSEGITAIRGMGAIGVDIFFVLSGFLIGGILLNNLENKKRTFNFLFNFWKRRWLRTLPNYFVVLILNIILIVILTGGLSINVGNYILFLQNMWSPHPDFFTEAWSLSVEEYAYLLLPAVIYLLINLFKPKSTSNAFLFTTILVIGILLVPKYYFYLTAEINT